MTDDPMYQALMNRFDRLEDRMDHRFDAVDSKFEKMDSRVDNVDVTLAKQAVVLEDHTRRSLANEKALETLKEELKPVITHVEIMKWAGSALLAVAGLGGAWELLRWWLSK